MRSVLLSYFSHILRYSLLEATQKRLEPKGKVMGLNNERKKEIDLILLVRLKCA